MCVRERGFFVQSGAMTSKGGETKGRLSEKLRRGGRGTMEKRDGNRETQGKMETKSVMCLSLISSLSVHDKLKEDTFIVGSSYPMLGNSTIVTSLLIAISSSSLIFSFFTPAPSLLPSLSFGAAAVAVGSLRCVYM